MEKLLTFIGLFILSALASLGVCIGWFVYNSPSFSVITSVYNYEEYVGETIQSVLASDYPYFELILVNDGSTDNSLDVIKKYAQKDRRIKVIDQKNQGLSIARNNAMKIAKGDYLWFVDADDYIDSTALGQLARQIKETNQPDLISFLMKPVDANGTFRASDGYIDYLPDVLKLFRHSTFRGRDLPTGVIMSYPVVSGKQVYSRKFLKEHNITFVPKLVFEDDVFFITTLEANARGTVIFKKLYYKRAHKKAITADKSRFYDSSCRLSAEMYKSLKNVGTTEERARSIFNVYFGLIFSRFTNKPQNLLEVEKMLAFVKMQLQDEFWIQKREALEHFLTEKSYLRKEKEDEGETH